jgi:hypothetical protein
MTAKSQALYAFPYLTCRNISSPEDEAQDRKVYSGRAPSASVLALEDNENVREYLVDAKGKQKHPPPWSIRPSARPCRTILISSPS